MHCLDSDIIIEYLRGNESIKSNIENLEKYEFFITSINLCELYRGAFLSQNSERAIGLINKFLETVNILDFDVYSCELYGKVYAELKKIGRLTQDSDLMIAAICIANNKILITKNKKHFEKIKGLKVEEW